MKEETENMTSNLEQDILSRRTFAIISHPDAGKTTLLKSYYYLVVRFVMREQLKEKKQANMQHLTGWKLRNNVVFLLHLQ